VAIRTTLKKFFISSQSRKTGRWHRQPTIVGLFGLQISF
jgi:hypothetical protein